MGDCTDGIEEGIAQLNPEALLGNPKELLSTSSQSPKGYIDTLIVLL